MTNEIGPTLHPLCPTTTPPMPVMLLSKLISFPSGGASQKHSTILINAYVIVAMSVAQRETQDTNYTGWGIDAGT